MSGDVVASASGSFSKPRDLHRQVQHYATLAGIEPDPFPGTVAEYLAEWLSLRELTLRPSTWHHYHAVIRTYLLPHVGNLLFDELTPALLERTFSTLLERGRKDGGPLSRSTVLDARRILGSALQDGIRYGLLFTNPVWGTRVPDPPGQKPFLHSIWTAEELREFLVQVRSHPLASLFVLAATTGMRRGELLGLSWGNVSLDQRRLAVTQQLVLDRRPGMTLRSSKGLRHSISLGEHAIAALREQRRRQSQARLAARAWHGHDDLVFTTSEGRPIRPSYVTSHFHVLVLASRLPQIRFHDLRHTHASLLLLSGVPAHVVSQRLGHADHWTTLKIYAHVLPILDHDAANKLEELIRASSPGSPVPHPEPLLHTRRGA